MKEIQCFLKKKKKETETGVNKNREEGGLKLSPVKPHFREEDPESSLSQSESLRPCCPPSAPNQLCFRLTVLSCNKVDAVVLLDISSIVG